MAARGEDRRRESAPNRVARLSSVCFWLVLGCHPYLVRAANLLHFCRRNWLTIGAVNMPNVFTVLRYHGAMLTKLWSQYKPEIERKAARCTADSLLDCANDALIWLSQYCAMSATVTLAPPYALPDNMVGGITAVYAGAELLSSYTVTPTGLVFPHALRTTPTLHYNTYWPAITTADSAISLPAWAFEAVKLYTAGRLLEDPATQMVLLTQYKTRVDGYQSRSTNPVLQVSIRLINEANAIAAARSR